MNCNLLTISEAKDRYFSLGLDPIPLQYLSKKPKCNSWNEKDARSLWEGLGDNVGIGLRCGGMKKFAVLDIDEKKKSGSVDFAMGMLEGLNIQPPIIKSASGIGCHIYLFLKDAPLNASFISLNSQYMAGELRFGPGAQVVAPPSIVRVDGVERRYELISGDLNNIPTVSFNDLSRFVNQHANMDNKRIVADLQPTNVEIIALSEEVLPSRIPASIMPLLEGEGIDLFRTRSHCEYHIIQTLVQDSFSFEEVLSVFRKYPCAGKFNSKGVYSIGWLRGNYEKALFVENTNNAKMARICISLLPLINFKGRSGNSDRAILRANLEIVRKTRKLSYTFDVRTGSEMAQVSIQTASLSQKRLIERGFINMENDNRLTDLWINKAVPFRFQLLPTKFLDPNVFLDQHAEGVEEENRKYTFHVKEAVVAPPAPNVECILTIPTYTHHDVFEEKALGKGAERIYEALYNNFPLTAQEISQETNISISTVRKHLNRMTNEDYFLTFPMAHGKWGVRRSPTLLDINADRMSVKGEGIRRKARHVHDREIFAEVIRRSRLSKSTAPTTPLEEVEGTLEIPY